MQQLEDTTTRRSTAGWQAPPVGVYKVNTDGSFNSSNSKSGIGVVIRDSNGQLIAALSSGVPITSQDATTNQALALRRGLVLAAEIGLHQIVVESEASDLIRLLGSQVQDFSDIGNIIADCKNFSLNFCSFSASHVRREGNKCAHVFAKHGAVIDSEEQVWIEDGPHWASSLLLSDVLNSH